MSLIEERRAYRGEEPELFKKIEQAHAETGSWVNIDGRVYVALEVVKGYAAVIVERFTEP